MEEDPAEAKNKAEQRQKHILAMYKHDRKEPVVDAALVNP